MAFIKPLTDPYGTIHNTGYFVPTIEKLSKHEKFVRFYMHGYTDSAVADRVKNGEAIFPAVTVEYVVRSDKFDDYFSTAALLDGNVYSACYNFVAENQCLRDDKGEIMSGDEPLFFADAVAA